MEPTRDPLSHATASQLSAAIHAGTLSCRELMTATLARIGRLNPGVNALVALADPARLLAEAEACDAERAQGRSRGWLHGIPLAFKDAVPLAGFPTTQGSPLLARHVTRSDGLVAARMKAAGGLPIARTNMPEFGLGSHTFNTVYGATRNPWDRAVSAGGSSGGAAAALALRLVAVADGSDFMGSLRNPAAWNNVFGLRPSAGRVPLWPAPDVWIATLGTEGPMATTVEDLARLLATQAGPDPRVPGAIAATLEPFAPRASLAGLRIGWLGDLGGHLAVEPGLLPVLEAALARCARDGAIVEPVADSGFDPARVWEAWRVWRAALVAPKIAALVGRDETKRAQVKPEALWELEQGEGLSAAALLKASEQRTAFLGRMLALFERFDVLALPATQVWPFPVDQRWPREIAGRTMDTYHRWMECTLYATFAGLPAIALPAGFHANGRWPAGLQWIGRPQGDAALLAAAAAYERLFSDALARRPPED